jgi:hypothetical protein
VSAARSRGPARALLVGHPGPDRDVVRLTLQRAGLELDERLELATGEALVRPRLVVQDAAVAREDREAEQSRLGTHAELRGVPLVVLSHNPGIDSFGGAFARGASAHLGRPLDEAMLWDTAKRLMAWRPPASNVAQAPRRPLVLPVDVELPERGWKRGQLLEASASGCRLTLPEPAPAGTPLGIVPVWEGAPTQIRLGGRVRWCRPEPLGSYLVGLRWGATGMVVVTRMFGLPARNLPGS